MNIEIQHKILNQCPIAVNIIKFEIKCKDTI